MLRSGDLAIVLSILGLYSCEEGKNGSDRQVIPPEGYTLFWADEFDKGERPDPEFWSYEQGFVRNQELQWYQSGNVAVRNGNLVIEGRRERVGNDLYDSNSGDWRKNREYAEYTSSSIHTNGKRTFLYGQVEVRAKIDTASGMWPAIWTLGIAQEWPSCGEIDMMEFYRKDGTPVILANAAWKGETEYVLWDIEMVPFSRFLEKDPNWANEFHIWKMDWSPEAIKLYLDGELLNEIDLDKTINPDGSNPFHQPHYLLLNLAIGSNGGDPSNTEFPKKYEVDYVRIYQKKQ